MSPNEIHRLKAFRILSCISVFSFLSVTPALAAIQGRGEDNDRNAEDRSADRTPPRESPPPARSEPTPAPRYEAPSPPPRSEPSPSPRYEAPSPPQRSEPNPTPRYDSSSSPRYEPSTRNNQDSGRSYENRSQGRGNDNDSTRSVDRPRVPPVDQNFGRNGAVDNSVRRENPKDVMKRPRIDRENDAKKGGSNTNAKRPDNTPDYRYPGKTPNGGDAGQVHNPPPVPTNPRPGTPQNPRRPGSGHGGNDDIHHGPRGPVHSNWRYFYAAGSPYDYPWDPFWSGCYYWNGSYHYWGGRFYSPYRDVYYWNWSRNYDEQKTYRTLTEEEIPFFFPPTPPPLGIPPPIPTNEGYAQEAPKTLGMYVNESFYPQLGTRLEQGALSKDMEARITKYRSDKLLALKVLREKLSELASLDPEGRRSALEAFSTQQAKQLEQLDADEEIIRSGLLSRGLLGIGSSSINWTEQRQWTMDKLGELKPDSRLRMLFLVVRAAPHYQAGLSTSQRRLAREASMELQMKAYMPEEEAEKSPKDETLVFFSPEMVQLRLPTSLSESLKAKFMAYDQAKRNLRADLVDAIRDHDAQGTNQRKRSFDALAKLQAPQFEALEVIADDIRAEIISTNSQFEPFSRLGLPSELIERANAYSRGLFELRMELLKTYEKLKFMVYPARLNMNTDKTTTNVTTVDFSVSPRLGQSDFRMRQMRKTLNDFNIERKQRFAELAAMLESIKLDVAAQLKEKGLGDKNADSVVREMLEWVRSKDYHTAVFEPGLSLEQRRLLFDAALEEMSLPLPPAE